MTCRLCLSGEEVLIPVYDEDGVDTKGIAETVAKCIGLQLAPDDPVSSTLCVNCWISIDNFQKFCIMVSVRQSQLQMPITIKCEDVADDEKDKWDTVKIEQTMYGEELEMEEAGDNSAAFVEDVTEQELEETTDYKIEQQETDVGAINSPKDSSNAAHSSKEMYLHVGNMDRHRMMNKISNGVYRLTPRTKSKSKIWSLFSQLQKEDGTTVKDIVYCRSCKRVYKFNGKQTSNLVRHKCFLMQKNDVPFRQLKQDEKQIVLDACAQWMIEDCRPYTAIDGNGFRKMLQKFIEIGAKFGEYLDLNDLVPDSTIISRRVNTMAADMKKEKKHEIKRIVDESKACITTHLWLDNFLHCNYLCATFHYIKEGQFEEMVLGVKPMDLNKSTDEDILQKMKNILAEFDIHSLENIIFVTDSGANIKSAFRNQKRINSSHHLFADVLDAAFEATVELQDIIENCNKLLKFLKKSKPPYLLPTTQKTHFMTRCNRQLNLFKTITENWSKINQVLGNNAEMHALSAISLLKVLVELCEHFELISQKLQGTQYVSICYVYPSINRLRKMCEVAEDDAPALSSLKRNILRQIDTKWTPNLSVYHRAAVFLYPPTNQMQSESITTEVRNFCITEILHNEKADSRSSTADTSDAPSCSSSKKARCTPTITKELEFFFPDLSRKTIISLSQSVKNEVQKYCWVKVQIDTNFDAIEWWEKHRTEYPHLSRFAVKILSIPASSAAAERVFTLASNIIADQRNCLMPQAVDSIVFLNSIFKEIN